MGKLQGILSFEALMETGAAVGIKILEVGGTLLLCWIIIRIVNRVAQKFFQKQTQKQRLAMSERKANTLNTITSSVLKYVVYFIGLFTILNLLGVDPKSLLVIASAGSVAIGLGAQSVVTDMLEGFFIFFEDHFAVGDVVTIQNITGTVESVTLRYTKIRDAQGKVHIIPNGSVGIVTNMSSEFINAIVNVGVAYEENIDHVLLILQDEMKKTSDMESILETPVILGVVGLDESAVTIRIVAKCMVKTNFAVEVELRRRIKNRFDQEEIEIPFPQRIVHIVKEKEEA
ncbi:mechanosensitive ion channel family protein [Anaerotignum propionicum]|jgi:small conductance mechanosensitive channel|uniref:mechanosensitive ion channel family protein n=1 Tax=Anaerotignum propionicum TaxID=28446 RepID=UPI0028988784|nr:mechanosensitive ion channel family protein [Anaerotignum propionicum]MEA5056864.1 mechanosensitive ion channel family protein [Anaerotignum propionicum]